MDGGLCENHEVFMHRLPTRPFEGNDVSRPIFKPMSSNRAAVGRRGMRYGAANCAGLASARPCLLLLVHGALVRHTCELAYRFAHFEFHVVAVGSHNETTVT